MREKPIEYTPRWRTLEKGDHSSFMQFYCAKCDSDDIELYGANMRWNYKRQRWQIVSPKDAMFQCFNCDEQTSYEESTRKKNMSKIMERLNRKYGRWSKQVVREGKRNVKLMDQNRY